MDRKPKIVRDVDVYGAVYFIGHGERGPVKVGFTACGDVEKRRKKLQTGNPVALIVIGEVYAHASIERVLHKFLKPRAVRGEWFERETALLLLHRMQHQAMFPCCELVRELALVEVNRPRYSDSSEHDQRTEVMLARALLDDWIHQLRQVNTVLPLPFKIWLSHKLREDSPAGDIAKLAAEMADFPESGTLKEYCLYVFKLRRRPACIRALVDAWIECDMEISGLGLREVDVWDWRKQGD